MPRLTPQELQEAKRRKAEEEAAERERQAAEASHQAEARARAKRERAERNAHLIQMQERYQQVLSVADALYEEVNKLTVKWPAMPVTERTLSRTNKVIAAVKELLSQEADDFVEDITEIVPAGDLPENRDILMMLRELRAALTRFGNKHQYEWQQARKGDVEPDSRSDVNDTLTRLLGHNSWMGQG